MLRQSITALLCIASLCLSGCGKNGQTNQPDPQPLPTEPVTRAEALARQVKNCDRIPKGLRTPSHFILIACGEKSLVYWVPAPIFTSSQVFFEAHQLILLPHPESDYFNIPTIDQKWLSEPGTEQLSGDIWRQKNGGNQGHDLVLDQDLQPYLYYHPKSRTVCRSTNMSEQPRALMVECFLRSTNWTLLAFGPETSVNQIVRNLPKIDKQLSRR